MEDTIGISLLVSCALKKKKVPYLVVASNLYKAQKIYDFLLTFNNDLHIDLFPSDELIRAEALASSKDMIASRIFTLNNIIHQKTDIVVANVASVAKFLPNPKVFKANCIHFEIGQEYNLTKLKRQLIQAGYNFVQKVDQSLQFASRGDILDIFSVNLQNPIRIEFFGDEIVSIREFEISTQTSFNKLDYIDILPANEFILTDNEIKNIKDKLDSILEKDKEVLDPNKFDQLKINTENDLVDLIECNYTPKLYKYFSLLCEDSFSLFNYCDGFNVVFSDLDAIKNSNDLLIKESWEYLSELNEEGKCVSHLELYQDIFKASYSSNVRCINTYSLAKKQNDIIFPLKGVPYQANKKIDAVNIIQNYLSSGYKINISVPNNEQLNLINEYLSEVNIPFEMVHGFDVPTKQKIGISLNNLSRGFDLPESHVVYLSSLELFNEKIRTGRFDSRFKQGTILKSFEDLEPGDYVVHEYQGIGQFLELQTLEVDGIHRDYLKIAYFGNELLYVPLAQFQLVRKYQGKEGISPRLSHLHSKDWENTKKRIKEKINDLANRLFALYTERNKVVGYQFQHDDEFQKQFEDACPFELTKDQQRSVDDIKKDMESVHPMDRLLCGDVGFGKTEVAFRAVFKAILSGKQVAFLCPTTLLARQHFERALERFAGFDIKIAVFSRLIPEKTQKKYIEGLATGEYHLAIGTHRLLSKEIVFKDLGLLVIDEEQRFGVEQKERLKELKNNIDVLTLSATPIPRTLQISLLGVRSLSQINTAPVNRMPIQTYVIPFKLDIVKELIERELGRGGQIFYLHNNVETLYRCANRIQKMLPEASIGVVHGQLEKDEIEDVMMKFYKGDIKILVCTSIIENGIDIPNANMIIVEDSENYGLSQLYQIKGRVGRSDRIAYAYLMYSENKVLKEKAIKRLKAISDFTELGSGYKIAQRDLMIRGAGDILGPDQAGFIDSIGLDMYIKLLNEAVQEKKDGELIKEEIEPNITLQIDAYIPSDYLNDSQKIELYQEIMAASSTESLLALKVKTKDVYGSIPESTNLLFLKRNVDLLLKESNIHEVKENYNNVELLLGEPYINIRGIGNLLFEGLIPYINRVKISYINHKFKLVVSKTKSMLLDLEGILVVLNNICHNNKVIKIE